MRHAYDSLPVWPSEISPDSFQLATLSQAHSKNKPPLSGCWGHCGRGPAPGLWLRSVIECCSLWIMGIVLRQFRSVIAAKTAFFDTCSCIAVFRSEWFHSVSAGFRARGQCLGTRELSVPRAARLSTASRAIRRVVATYLSASGNLRQPKRGTSLRNHAQNRSMVPA